MPYATWLKNSSIQYMPESRVLILDSKWLLRADSFTEMISSSSLSLEGKEDIVFRNIEEVFAEQEFKWQIEFSQQSEFILKIMVNNDFRFCIVLFYSESRLKIYRAKPVCVAMQRLYRARKRARVLLCLLTSQLWNEDVVRCIAKHL